MNIELKLNPFERKYVMGTDSKINRFDTKVGPNLFWNFQNKVVGNNTGLL